MPDDVSTNARLIPLWEFMTHIAVGTGIFILIAAPALGLNVFILWLKKGAASGPIIIGLEIAEYCLFFIDLLMFVVFLVRAAWRTIPKL